MAIAIASPRYAAGVGFVGVCLLVALAATNHRRDRHADECPFEQTWYAGDVHFNERIEFRPDASGTWISSGFDSDARQERKEFRWARTASTLTVRYDRDVQNQVPYEIERRSTYCSLRFDEHPFLPDGSGFTHFTDSE